MRCSRAQLIGIVFPLVLIFRDIFAEVNEIIVLVSNIPRQGVSGIHNRPVGSFQPAGVSLCRAGQNGIPSLIDFFLCAALCVYRLERHLHQALHALIEILICVLVCLCLRLVQVFEIVVIARLTELPLTGLRIDAVLVLILSQLDTLTQHSQRDNLFVVISGLV